MSNILTNNINPRSGNVINIGGVNDTVSIAGTVTYEDVTSVDSIGVVTARSGLNVVGGGITAVGVITSYSGIHVGAGVSAVGTITAQSGVEFGTVGSGVTISAVGAGTSLGFLVNGSERVRIDSSGRLLVGTSSASTNGLLTVQCDANQDGIVLRAENTGGQGSQPGIVFEGPTGTELVNLYVDNNASELRIKTAGTERMRVDSEGSTTLTSPSLTNAALYVKSTGTSNFQRGIIIEFPNRTPNDANSYFWSATDSTSSRAVLMSNGGLHNYSANNVNLSDRNVKKDIEPAAGTWDCLKEWEIVNFRYVDQPDDANLNMGVIAQQVAESCPEVVTVFQEAQEATETEPAQEERIGVKDQQMVWMAIKALQEAQLRIETLEAKVQTLEGGAS